MAVDSPANIRTILPQRAVPAQRRPPADLCASIHTKHACLSRVETLILHHVPHSALDRTAR